MGVLRLMSDNCDDCYCNYGENECEYIEVRRCGRNVEFDMLLMCVCVRVCVVCVHT